MSVNRQTDKEAVVRMHNGILLNHWQEWNNAVRSNMDGPRDCHSEWSESETKITWESLCTHACVCAKLLQSCLSLYDPMDCSPPGSSVHGDSPGKSTRAYFHALFQGLFPTHGSNAWLFYLLRWQADSLSLVPPGKPNIAYLEFKKKDANKPIYKTETDSEKTNLRTPEAKVGRGSCGFGGWHIHARLPWWLRW